MTQHLVSRVLDLLAGHTRSESIDVLVTWVGAITLFRYQIALRHRGERSALERRTGFLVSALALHLALRGFSWLRPEVRWLGALMLVPAALVPLAMTLFVEGLLRRHVPHWMKWASVVLTIAATGTAVTLTLRSEQDEAGLLVLLGAMLFTMVVLATLLARRDRASLSRSENGLVRALLVVTVLAIPLVASDFRFMFGWPPARMGTIVALLFCYTLLRRPQEHAQLRRWVLDVARLLVRAAVVCLLLLLALRGAPAELLVPISVLATALVLAVAIADRLADASATRADTALLRWLARPAPRTLREFVRELHHLSITADALVLDASDLGPYDHDALRATLSLGRPVHSRARLREERAAAGARGRGADELTDLLERTGMTHVALLSAHPVHLLLANIPELPGKRDVELGLAAVMRHGQLTIAHEALAERHRMVGA